MQRALWAFICMSFVHAGWAAVPVDVEVCAVKAMAPVELGDAIADAVRVDVFSPSTPIGQFGEDAGGQVFVTSGRRAAEGELLGLDGTEIVANRLMGGLTRKSLAPIGADWLVAVDYSPGCGNDQWGILQMAKDGSYRRWELKRTDLHGLMDIEAVPGGGWMFCDFERDNIWYLAGEGIAEVEQIAEGAPAGMVDLVFGASSNECYVLNQSGAWPKGGEDAVYRVEEGRCVVVAKPPAGCSFGGIGYSDGKLFPRGLYASIPQEGRVVRIGAEGELEDVARGFDSPHAIHFGAKDGALHVISRQRVVVRLGAKGKAVPSRCEPFVAGETRMDLGPVAGAAVDLGGVTLVADDEGRVRFFAAEAGQQRISASKRGHKPLSLMLDAGGSEEPVVLALESQEVVDVSGVITDAVSGLPVAGARIELTPKDVQDVLHGGMTGASGFDGRFLLIDLSEGVYGVAIRAPGMEDVTQDWTVDGRAHLFAVAMQPKVFEETALRVQVKDEKSGKALADAEVVLEPAFGAGVWAQDKTDGMGKVLFPGLRTGIRTRMHGSVAERPVMRRNGVVSVSAEGYVPRVLPVSLDQGVLSVSLQPVVPIEGAEPNESMTDAQPVAFGCPVVFQIDRNDDVDVFMVELSREGRINAVIEPAPIQLHVRVMNQDGRVLADRGYYQNQPIDVGTGGLRPGTYFVQVEEWGRNSSSLARISLTINLTPCPDFNEPNDTLDTARLLRVGETVWGTIAPVGDQDYFRFRVERPGKVRVTVPAMPMQRYAAIYDLQTNRIAEAGRYENQDIVMDAWVKPGEYALLVGEWGNNGESLVPYAATLDFMADDGVDDPAITNVPLRAVRKLGIDTKAGSTIWPLGDQDLYEVNLPSAGRLNIEGSAPIQTYVAIYRPDGTMIVDKGCYDQQWLHAGYYANGPETVYVLVTEWGNNDASPNPYRIVCRFDPAEDMEKTQRNETMETAFPLSDGEWLTGTIFPLHDRDFYRMEIPFPGWLHIKGTSPVQMLVNVYDAQTNTLLERGFHPPHVDAGLPVVPGSYWLRLMEWGDNDCSLRPYHIRAKLERSEPWEAGAGEEERARELVVNRAQSFSFDLLGDVDTFIYENKTGTNFVISCLNPLQTFIRVFDSETDARVVERGFHPGTFSVPVQANAVNTYRIELREWGDNARSFIPGYLLISDSAKTIPADDIFVESAGNRQIYISRSPKGGAERPGKVVLDINNDGRGDVEVQEEGETLFRLPEAGVFAAKAIMTGSNGVISVLDFWIDAQEPEKRQGLALMMALEDGKTLLEPERMEVRAVSYTRAAVEKVTFTLDGRETYEAYSAPYEMPLVWDRLGAGEHELEVKAVDTRGNEARLTRRFRLSPFFGLQPRDGAELSGEHVLVSWTGSRFGAAEVHFREEHEKHWRRSVGEDGRFRSVLLEGLEAGKTYFYKAVSGDETSPERAFKLVKGLAFGRSSYGANINRDYNQRVGISVRNNSEAPLTVRLECGQPADPLMLVSFVGEGSEDKPFILQPGEEREFMLGISAQDVMTEQHTVPVRIVSEDGLTDEAVVNLSVRLPKIDLRWKFLGETDYGLGRRYRISNHGDTITDLAVESGTDDVQISPSIYHGLLAGGRSVDVTVTPRLYDGFHGVRATLSARGLDKVFSEEYEVKLGPDEKLYQVYLLPEGDTMDAGTYAAMVANVKAASALDPDRVEWSARELPEDLDGDGLPDRWYVFAPDDVLWVGDDTEGNGEIDFVHADIGMDGVFEYSAFRKDGKWEETNIVEAWLEMGFSLPWNRNTYHPHDVDIVMNGMVIGRLRDTIPDGNYAFFIPPRAFRFNERGEPADNQIGIRSMHLRGGHYVVNSDFRFNIRLTATPVWSVGRNQEEAYKKAMKIEGLSLNAPDYSISSSDVEVIGAAELHAGMPVWITVPMRNLGAMSPPDVPVVLLDKPSGMEAVEVARVIVEDVPDAGVVLVRIPWTATGGRHELRIVADPDGLLGDQNRSNNEARLFLEVIGENTPPMVEILSPADGAILGQPVAALRVRAQDDTGVGAVLASIDGGLWTELAQGPQHEWAGNCLLQPGERTIRVRAVDENDAVTEKTITVRVDRTPPEAEIVYPSGGTNILARSTHVYVKIPPEVALVGVRMRGYPWQLADIVGRTARVHIPLYYGEQQIEVLAAARDGTVALLTQPVVCGRQPLPGQKLDPRVKQPEPGVLRVSGLGEVDLFRQVNVVVPVQAGRK